MAESWSQNVFSKMCTNVAYDGDTGDLVVTWNNGRRSAYAGVPEDVAWNLANAPSVGSMINEEIKPNYAHRYL